MKHQRIQNHLSRSEHLQMSQIENIITNFHINRIFHKNITFPLTNKSPHLHLMLIVLRFGRTINFIGRKAKSEI